jgi:hypothetical protein
MVQHRQSELSDLLTAVRARIEVLNREKAELVAALTEMLAAARTELDGIPPGRARQGKGGRRPGFKMSAEAKARISAAAKKRWAAWRREQK